MSLKDLMVADLDSFLNVDEFAETVEINGVSMNVLIDNDLLKTYNDSKNYIEGLSNSDTLFYVKVDEYGEEPNVGEIITFGNRKKRITKVDKESSIYIIELQEFFS